MKYKVQPHIFPLEVKKIKTKYDTPEIRKNGALEENTTLKGLANVLRAKNKFLSKIPYAAYKIYNFGERGSGCRILGDVQDFKQIKNKCLREKILWRDPEFLPEIKSCRSDNKLEVTWKRPSEIVKNPLFFADGYCRFDVKQGAISDCWLIATVASITLNERIFSHVVPKGQSFTKNYAGVFHFRFWQYGRWIDVVVDDRLPTHKNRLIYMTSTNKNEFWSALLEKAYAKVNGSYDALAYGLGSEAMEDLTGGLTEKFDLEECSQSLCNILVKAYERNSLMSCYLNPDPAVREKVTPEGLVRGHAYSITSVNLVHVQELNDYILLLRLRNPWGDATEWNGSYSDNSPEWNRISEKDKKKLNLTFKADGEFWMEFHDFCKHFNSLDVTNLSPDSVTEEELQEGNKRIWELSVFEGQWIRGISDGGCRNYIDTFARNPQYLITLTEPDDNDDDETCTVIVALMLKYRRLNRELAKHCVPFGFTVYHLPYPENVPKPLDRAFFSKTMSVPGTSLYSNVREVNLRFKLPPGTYCIVPSTFEPYENGEFLLRVFSEHQNKMKEHDVQICLLELVTRATNEEIRMTERIRELFLKTANEDMQVDWVGLKQILDYAFKAEIKEGFSKDNCKSLIAMMDTDYSGKLGLEEFKIMWSDIRKWKRVFKLHEYEKIHQLKASHLRSALATGGFNVNADIVRVIFYRFNSKENFTLKDFIMSTIVLKTLIDVFKEKDLDNMNAVKFSIEEWLQKTIYV